MTATPPPRPPAPDLRQACHALMERSPMPMAELEGEGHIVRYVNPAFCRLVGKPEKTLVASPFAETVREGDGCLAVLERVYRSGEPETHTEPEHGESHPAYWSYSVWPVLGADQHPVGVMMQVTETTRFHWQVGAINEALLVSSVRQHELTEAAERLNARLQTEIADRKAAHEALRKSEAWQRLLLDHVEDFAIFSLSKEGLVTDWNAGAKLIFGYSREEIIGQSGRVIFTAEDRVSGVPEEEMHTAASRGSAIDERWHQRKNGDRFFASGTMRPLRDESGRHLGFVKVARDITERKQHEEHQKMLLNELTHRVKNTLATVQAIAMQTMRNAPTMQAFQEAFESRLDALAKAHNLLMQNPSQIATLRGLVLGELSHYAADDASRYAIEGEDVPLPSNRAVPIGMMFHELATNAVKYGALSAPSGRVSVSWTVDRRAWSLHLEWIEAGGPAVREPTRRGFGSRLIERGLAHELDAKVRLTFDPTGIRCTMDIPLPSIVKVL
jgi:PAS domain S-box-containing protein